MILPSISVRLDQCVRVDLFRLPSSNFIPSHG